MVTQRTMPRRRGARRSSQTGGPVEPFDVDGTPLVLFKDIGRGICVFLYLIKLNDIWFYLIKIELV